MTDPARTTKEERDHCRALSREAYLKWQAETDPADGGSAWDGWNAGRDYAADALRAQVAALRSRADASDTQLCRIASWCERVTGIESNAVIGKDGWPRMLCDVVAQAVDAQVAALQAENERLRKLCDERFAQVAQADTELAAAQAKLAVPVDESGFRYIKCHKCGDEFVDPALADAHDEIAALRTRAEALERERDAYKGMLELVERIPTMTDEQLEQLRKNALAAKALAEKL